MLMNTPPFKTSQSLQPLPEPGQYWTRDTVSLRVPAFQFKWVLEWVHMTLYSDKRSSYWLLIGHENYTAETMVNLDQQLRAFNQPLNGEVLRITQTTTLRTRPRVPWSTWVSLRSAHSSHQRMGIKWWAKQRWVGVCWCREPTRFSNRTAPAPDGGTLLGLRLVPSSCVSHSEPSGRHEALTPQVALLKQPPCAAVELRKRGPAPSAKCKLPPCGQLLRLGGAAPSLSTSPET